MDFSGSSKEEDAGGIEAFPAQVHGCSGLIGS
jgi:hypothetical protein